MDFISSSSNPQIKQITRLDKKREREKSGTFLVEGIREIQLAARSGVEILNLFVNQKWDDEDLLEFERETSAKRITGIETALFEKLTYRGNVKNALALCSWEQRNPDDLVVKDNSVFLVLEALEKPGNIGAIFRSADAAGVDAILIADEVTDMLNPNVIRASLGTLFTVPFVTGSNEEIYQWLRSKKFRIISTWLEASKSHYLADYSGKSAIVMGSEAFGITEFWQKNTDETVKIPMRGEADSMNVSTATAVMIYESLRHRLI
ncbi:MAG: RNA methyltransferase [Bacteroidetes bacterium]|nr:RNA methyltransferase [Bacteroidota bacterium]